VYSCKECLEISSVRFCRTISVRIGQHVPSLRKLVSFKWSGIRLSIGIGNVLELKTAGTTADVLFKAWCGTMQIVSILAGPPDGSRRIRGKLKTAAALVLRLD